MRDKSSSLCCLCRFVTSNKTKRLFGMLFVCFCSASRNEQFRGPRLQEMDLSRWCGAFCTKHRPLDRTCILALDRSVLKKGLRRTRRKTSVLPKTARIIPEEPLMEFQRWSRDGNGRERRTEGGRVRRICVGTSASLVVTSALLVVTRSY